MTSALDVPALLTIAGVAALVTAVLAVAERGGKRRVWLAAAACAAVLLIAGVLDLLRETPRETHIATPFTGALLPVLGAAGMLAGTRRVRPWIRIPLIWVTTLVLVLAGLLVGAALVPRLLGS